MKTNYYPTTYHDPRTDEFFCAITERKTGRVIYNTATYPTPTEAEQTAAAIIAEKKPRDAQTEQAYIDHLKGYE